MNFVKTTILSLGMCSLLWACGGDEDGESELTLEVIPELSFVLGGTADSCADRVIQQLVDEFDEGNSVAGPRVTFQKITLAWDNEERILTIFDLTLEVAHANVTGGRYQVSLSGDEIDGLFSVESGIVGVGPVLRRSTQPDPPNPEFRETSFPNCSLDYGGIALDNEQQNFTTSGRLTLRGMSTDEKGADPRPEKATVSVRIRNEY